MAGEDFIQFIWKHRLYKGKALHTTCGRKLMVLLPGEQNFHAGPDFFNARIRLDHLMWAGNVEVHRRASDWYRHGHHIDPGYNNVILHVVGDYDSDITNSLGRRIHTMVPDYPTSLILRYEALKKNDNWLPCSSYIKDFPPHKLKQWLNRLQTQRTAQKSLRMDGFRSSSDRGKEETFYLALASGFGLPVNSLPFELLSKGIPFQQLTNHRDNLSDLEALCFGHSGLLYPARGLGPYPSSLWERYLELRHLLPGDPVPHHLWKFLRLRPASFPTLRISQFAFTLHQRAPLVDNILSAGSLAELEQLFRAGASEYWDTHYLFGKCSPPCPKYLGQHTAATLIINVIVPFLYALERVEPGSKSGSRAVEILSQMKAESNQVIHNWQKFGIIAENARESQALLQLYNVFCKQKRCLDCQIGASLMEDVIHEKK
ncbi:MAG: DUF2851 family protein [Bacteroidales bacterium]|nr:DUF2851 family protein [Bacteroidales bacterium]